MLRLLPGFTLTYLNQGSRSIGGCGRSAPNCLHPPGCCLSRREGGETKWRFLRTADLAAALRNPKKTESLGNPLWHPRDSALAKNLRKVRSGEKCRLGRCKGWYFPGAAADRGVRRSLAVG
jgi:hypothetical protein